MRRTLYQVAVIDLDVRIVSGGLPDHEVERLVEEFR